MEKGMSYRRAALIIIFVASLAACGAIPGKRPPSENLASVSPVISRRLPTDQEKWSQTSIPQSYFGVSTASSLGTTLVKAIFGGVGSNSVLLQSRNEDNAQRVRDFGAVDLSGLISAATGVPIEGKPDGDRHFVLVPSDALTFESETSFYQTCVITAYLTPGDTWNAAYRVTRDMQFDSSSPSMVAGSRRDLSECFKEAYRLFLDHIAGRDGPYTVRTIKANGAADIVMSIQDKGLPERIVGNDNVGLTEFRKIAVSSVE